MQVALPKLTVRRTAGHCAEKKGVDLDDLLHGLRADVRPLRRARVDGHADTALVHKGKTSCSFRRFNHFIFRIVAAGHSGAREAGRLRAHGARSCGRNGEGMRSA